MTLTGHAHRLHARLAAHTDTLTRLERQAWALGLVLFVGADVATTAIGLHVGAVEGNAAGHTLMQAVGVWPAMLIGKLGAVALFGAAWLMLRRTLGVDTAESIPVLVAWLGGAVTLWNSYVVAVHAGLL